MASLQDSRALTWQIRLVVLREFDCLAALADYTARITGISAIDGGWCDQDHVCSAASLIRVVLPWHIVGVLSAESFELFATGWCQEHLIDLNEDSLESLLVVLFAEVWIIFELFYKVCAAILGNLCTSMAIKDGKEGEARDKVDSCDVCIFVALAPALHARRSESELNISCERDSHWQGRALEG